VAINKKSDMCFLQWVFYLLINFNWYS
jgi:hypothetical protein